MNLAKPVQPLQESQAQTKDRFNKLPNWPVKSKDQTALTERPSPLVPLLLKILHRKREPTIITQNATTSVVPGDLRDYPANRCSTVKMPDVPNLGTLVHTDIETRMLKTPLEKFVNSDSHIYPFEVLVTMNMPKPNNFMWDFKHSFYLSIMYSQVYRYFFPYNRHNSQLFFVITNEQQLPQQQSDEQLLSINIPSRIMFRSMHFDVYQQESVILAAVSAYKDYVAFFRLSSKPQECPDAYKNFFYIPPVWTNKLDG